MLNEAFKSRFHKRLSIAHEELCWEWTGWKNEKGYGRLRYQKTNWFAHRLAYAMTYNVVLEPTDIVMHICNNPRCCNPAHLKLGTILENNLQKIVENRANLRNRKSRWKKLSHEEVLTVKLRLKNGHGISNLAYDFSVTTQCIRNIKNNVTWKSVKLPSKEIFEYDPFGDD